MKLLHARLFAAAVLAASFGAVGVAWYRAQAADRAAAELLASRLEAPIEARVLEPLFDEEVEGEDFESETFHDVIGIGGGAGGSFGGRFGGSRNLRAAGGVATRGASNEVYVAAEEPGFRDPRANPYSTFSVDVDTASFTNVRRFLNDGELPPADAVRVEELLNSFEYRYPDPTGEHPLAVYSEVATCPWNQQHRLLRVGLQAARVSKADRKPLNLVFLIDVSGSMSSERKLPLVTAGLKLLARELDERDTIAIVTYSGRGRIVLEPTPGHHDDGILAVLDGLRAGGSTNGEGGIQIAYRLAEASKRPGVESRVILATDGDFNVGISDRDKLVELVAEKAKAGVSLTVLGFGTGNLKDATLEQLADNGDGNYAYVDSLVEARRLFGDGLAGTLVTAAKDVKLQVEFNPVEVASYRLVGYANRQLADRDFNDDAKDAGDVGVGHSVTALYEIVPTALVGVGDGFAGIAVRDDSERPEVDPTRYQTERALAGAAFAGELANVKIRYKRPGGTESTAFEAVARDDGADWASASTDLRFAAATAMFGEALSGSTHRGTGTLAQAQLLLLATLHEDPSEEREALLDLVRRARELGAI